MGDYTGLRFKGIVKKEYRDDIKTLLETEDYSKLKHDIFKEFTKCERYSMIPFGNDIEAVESRWETNQNKDGFDTKFNYETGFFSFQCCLKNYDSTIEYYLEKVVPEVYEKIIHCEYLYCYDTVSRLYKLYELEHGTNTIKQIEYGIQYYYNTDDINIVYDDFDFNIDKEFI